MLFEYPEIVFFTGNAETFESPFENVVCKENA